MADSTLIVTVFTNVTISLVGTVANLLMVLAYCCRREVRETSSLFTVVTFITGAKVSLIYYPTIGLVDTHIITNNPLCSGVILTGIFLALILTLIILALTVERYIYICHPLRAATLLTKRRVVVTLVSLYVYCGVLAYLIPLSTPIGFKGDISHVPNRCRISSVVPHRNYISFIFANYLLPIPLMIIIYCRIFQIMRRHTRAVATTAGNRWGAVVAANGATGETADAASLEAANMRRRWKREAKSAVLLFGIIVSFAFCWMPFVAFTLIRSFSSLVTPMAYSLIHAVVFSVVVINPLVYGLGNKPFRHAIATFFSRRSSRNNDFASWTDNTVTSTIETVAT